VATTGAEGILRESTAGVVSESSAEAEADEDEDEDDVDCETRTGGWAGSSGEDPRAFGFDVGAAVSGDDPIVNTSWHRPGRRLNSQG
jgi:hypothetical protein